MSSLESVHSDWSNKTLSILHSASPTSLKVTHRAFRLGAHMSLEDNLIMEFRMSQASVWTIFTIMHVLSSMHAAVLDRGMDD